MQDNAPDDDGMQYEAPYEEGLGLEQDMEHTETETQDSLPPPPVFDTPPALPAPPPRPRPVAVSRLSQKRVAQHVTRASKRPKAAHRPALAVRGPGPHAKQPTHRRKNRPGTVS